MCRELTDEPLLIRLDSGNDAAENIGILVESGCYFIVKRNLRKESREDWLKMVQENSLDTESLREGKTVYIGSDWKSVSYLRLTAEVYPDLMKKAERSCAYVIPEAYYEGN